MSLIIWNNNTWLNVFVVFKDIKGEKLCIDFELLVSKFMRRLYGQSLEA